jgi:hypothetical protein
MGIYQLFTCLQGYSDQQIQHHLLKQYGSTVLFVVMAEELSGVFARCAKRFIKPTKATSKPHTTPNRLQGSGAIQNTPPLRCTSTRHLKPGLRNGRSGFLHFLSLDMLKANWHWHWHYLFSSLQLIFDYKVSETCLPPSKIHSEHCSRNQR